SGGKMLGSAGADTTALIWDVTKVKPPAAPAKALEVGDLTACWQALAGGDAAKAGAALADLVAAPKQAVAFLKEHVQPAAPIDIRRVGELMAQLDDGQYKVREKANAELLKMGDHVVPILDRFLAGSLS